MVKHFLFIIFSACALTFLVHAQDQSGFISLDCGIPEDSSYTDEITGIRYTTDAAYIDTGVSRGISPTYKTNSLEQQFSNVRSFLQGTRNCYTLTPPQVSGDQYLIRARFMYGNYDTKNQPPQFNLSLGTDTWDTVQLIDATKIVTKEILYVSSSKYLSVCLINTGLGTPFISALELRLLDGSIYEANAGSLSLFIRYDLGSSANSKPIRFQDDEFDRIWAPFERTGVSEISTSLIITENVYKVPSAVMNTAITPEIANNSLDFNWEPSDPHTQYYMYLHFADIQNNQSREFNIYINEELWYGPLQPGYLVMNTIYSQGPKREAWFNFSLRKTYNSTLPPILNAIEVYTVIDLSQLQTAEEDVDAINSIKSTYGVKKNWEGDPCKPDAYLWEGLNCSYDSYNLPRIVSLDLSSSGLTGKISPYLSNLSWLQSLDLSNNNLTGEVPDFLSQMQKLSVINLAGNNLTGNVPEQLIEKSKSGSLNLSFGGNPYLCPSEICNNTNTTTTTKDKKKKNSIVVPVVASVAGVAVLFVACTIMWLYILKREKTRQRQQVANVLRASAESKDRDVPLKAKNQQFTYSEVLSITNNFQRAIGKGGFGTVYLGILDGTQVAVKMLSPSSAQGYKEFRAEAELLMRVHHRNLTSLVGYCDDGDNMGLIYEYMANGSLEKHLSDRCPNILSWETRLKIALDAALGLEYLHHGCKPPIIHRDVKSTNILLDEKFQAKLADFGLSRVFPIEGGSHVSTAVVGTPGYYVSYKLNEKSDVYSFGVVLLEIITGQFAIARKHEKTHISQWVSHCLETKGDIRDVADSRLYEEFDVNSVWKAVEVALDCVSPTSAKRPFMNDVAVELKQCLVLEKARMNRGSQSVSQDSVEMVLLNVDSRMSPQAR